MIYVDSSALVKLVHEERESAALETWLSLRGTGLVVTSELAVVEVVRACRRVDAAALHRARTFVTKLNFVPLTHTLLTDAAELGAASLRSLDAIHLASAMTIRDRLSAFVAYDYRLTAAAEAAGLVTAQPGA